VILTRHSPTELTLNFDVSISHLDLSSRYFKWILPHLLKQFSFEFV